MQKINQAELHGDLISPDWDKTWKWKENNARKIMCFGASSKEVGQFKILGFLSYTGLGRQYYDILLAFLRSYPYNWLSFDSTACFSKIDNHIHTRARART